MSLASLLLVALTLPLAAAGVADPMGGPAAVLQVRVQITTPHTATSGAQTLTELALLHAVATRLPGVNVATASAARAQNLWWVLVAHDAPDMLTLCVIGDTGGPLLERRVAHAGMRPDDLAFALALLVAEALLPVRARLDGSLPIADPIGAATAAAAPEPGPKLELKPWHLGLDGGALGSWRWPRREIVTGAGAGLRVDHRALWTELRATWWEPVMVTSSDVRARTRWQTYDLLVGAMVQRDWLALTLGAGPRARHLHTHVTGSSVVIQQRDVMEWGVHAVTGLDARWRTMRIGLRLDATRFLQWHRILVDSTRRAVSSHTDVGVGLVVGWEIGVPKGI